MDFLKRLTGLGQGAATGDVVKFLLANAGGKLSAVITVLLGILYLITPEVGGHWGSFLGRAQVTCLSWLVAAIFWRGVGNQKMLAQALAQKQISDPMMADSSPNPAIQREITKQLNGGSHAATLNGNANASTLT